MATTVPATTGAPATVATTTTAPPTTTTTTTTTTLPPPTDPPTTTTTLAPVLVVDPPIQAVKQNDGDETARVQARLLELGFWVSGVDGDFGLTTKQAVMAFQKYVGIEADGSVGPITADFLTQMTERAKPQIAVDGDQVEVDKDRQVLFIIVRRPGRVDAQRVDGQRAVLHRAEQEGSDQGRVGPVGHPKRRLQRVPRAPRRAGGRATSARSTGPST